VEAEHSWLALISTATDDVRDNVAHSRHYVAELVTMLQYLSSNGSSHGNHNSPISVLLQWLLGRTYRLRGCDVEKDEYITLLGGRRPQV